MGREFGFLKTKIPVKESELRTTNVRLLVGIHNKPYFEGDEILPKEMGHFYGRTFKWDGVVDRLYEHHQVIQKQKDEGLAGEEGKPIRFNLAMVMTTYSVVIRFFTESLRLPQFPPWMNTDVRV